MADNGSVGFDVGAMIRRRKQQIDEAAGNAGNEGYSPQQEDEDIAVEEDLMAKEDQAKEGMIKSSLRTLYNRVRGK